MLPFLSESTLVNTIHSAARAWRQSLGITGQELASTLGIRKSVLCEWERGKRTFSEKAERRVVDALVEAAKLRKDERLASLLVIDQTLAELAYQEQMQ